MKRRRYKVQMIGVPDMEEYDPLIKKLYRKYPTRFVALPLALFALVVLLAVHIWHVQFEGFGLMLVLGVCAWGLWWSGRQIWKRRNQLWKQSPSAQFPSHTRPL